MVSKLTTILYILLIAILTGCGQQEKVVPTPNPDAIDKAEWDSMPLNKAVFGSICNLIRYSDKNNIDVIKLTGEQAKEAGMWGAQNMRPCLDMFAKLTFNKDEIATYSIGGCAAGIIIAAQEKLTSAEDKLKYQAELNDRLRESYSTCNQFKDFWESIGNGIAKSRVKQ